MSLHACDPAFLPLLAGFDLDELERHGGTVFGLWPDLRLACFNEAWVRFARENAGEPGISARFGLGVSIAGAMRGPLRAYYAGRFTGVLRTKRPWEHRYECSSPELSRFLHLTAHPLAGGEGLLVVNSTVVERAHDVAGLPAHAADPRAYLDEQGNLRQCGHCRRTQRTDAPLFWDWVPAWVGKSPANTNHDLCPVCLDYYYPDLDPQAVCAAGAAGG